VQAEGGPPVVAFGGLDPHHLGAEHAQAHPGERSLDPAGGLHHPDAGEGQVGSGLPRSGHRPSATVERPQLGGGDVEARLGPIEVLIGLGVDVVVAESSARYLASARFDQEIDIEVRLVDLTTSSMTTAYAFRHGHTLLAEGRVRHVGVHPRDLTKRPWPDEVRAAFTRLL